MDCRYSAWFESYNPICSEQQLQTAEVVTRIFAGRIANLLWFFRNRSRTSYPVKIYTGKIMDPWYGSSNTSSENKIYEEKLEELRRTALLFFLPVALLGVSASLFYGLGPLKV